MRRAAVPAALALTLGLAACGGQEEPAGGSATGGAGGNVSGEVLADGSSTVQPLAAAAGELFKEENSAVNVSVGTSGTGGGFEVFCKGSIDISDASRPIKAEEAAACKAAGIEYTQLHVATDALTVVAAKNNNFLTCLTTPELKKLWEPAATKKVTTWNQVNPKFPNRPIQLYGPGTDSGTFDYFTDEINGKEGASRTDYNASEDDNVLAQGVSGSPNALGYFGYTYFEENVDKLKAVSIDSGKGCVAPSAETAQNETYTPLSRPLFIYVSNKAAAAKPQVKAFVTFYAENDEDIAKTAKFIALNSQQRTELQNAVKTIG